MVSITKSIAATLIAAQSTCAVGLELQVKGSKIDAVIRKMPRKIQVIIKQWTATAPEVSPATKAKMEWTDSTVASAG